MYHVTIITYHIIQKLALLCENWKLQQRVILFMSAYYNNKETVTLNSSLSVFLAVTVGYIRYQHTISFKLYDLKIESFCFLLVAVSTLKKTLSIKKKIHSGLFFTISYYWY